MSFIRSSFAALIALAVVLVPSRVAAHPGSGIVVDRNGNVYFIRYGQNVVMRLTPNGTLTEFVGGGRLRLPHHLVLGKDGVLYVASDVDGIVWRVTPDGKVVEHFNSGRVQPGVPPMRQFQVGFGGDPFTVDSVGNVFAFVREPAPGVIRVTTSGVVTRIAANAKFGDLHFSTMTWGADGSLYFTDRVRVWRIRNDTATSIEPHDSPLVQATGIAVDSTHNIYVVDHERARVVRFDADGSVSTPRALRRLNLFRPTGVTVANGDIYVLDPSPGTRVWRIHGDAVTRVYNVRDPEMYVMGAILTLVTLLFAAQTLQRKPSNFVDWLAWTILAGGVIGFLYWVGRGAFVFSIVRHAILACFILGTVKSYRRISPKSP